MNIGNKKIQKAWTFYDWANSVYPLVISSAIFPIFYEGYVDEKVIFLDSNLLILHLLLY